MAILDTVAANTSPARIIAGIIEADGEASPGNAAWSLSIGIENATPVNTVTVYDTGGREPDTSELDIKRALVQVRVRSLTLDAGYEKQGAIFDALKAVLGAEYPSITPAVRVLFVMKRSEIVFIGKSDNDSFLHTASYEVQLQPTT